MYSTPELGKLDTSCKRTRAFDFAFYSQWFICNDLYILPDAPLVAVGLYCMYIWGRVRGDVDRSGTLPQRRAEDQHCVSCRMEHTFWHM
jgi:hypothetical protein